jgi:hypothetical protein
LQRTRAGCSDSADSSAFGGRRSPLNGKPLGPPLAIARLMLMVAALSAIGSPMFGVADGPKQEVDWLALSRAWQAYRSTASASAAEQAYRLLPLKPLTIGGYGHSEIVEQFYGSLNWLEPRVMAGDRWSTRIAFRFCALADAAFAEDLFALLGNMIRLQPQLFLEELEANRESVRRLDDIVLSYGVDEYANSSKPHEDYLAELRSRLLALDRLKVANQRLRRLRDDCDRLLSDEIAHPKWND